MIYFAIKLNEVFGHIIHHNILPNNKMRYQNNDTFKIVFLVLTTYKNNN